MSDRELLELAAKAAGIEIHQGLTDEKDGLGCSPTLWLKTGNYWNPLEDEGDALRLAVKLSLVYMPYPNDMAVRVTRLALPEFIEHYGNTNDPYTATRRAITCAAAEIGRNMK